LLPGPGRCSGAWRCCARTARRSPSGTVKLVAAMPSAQSVGRPSRQRCGRLGGAQSAIDGPGRSSAERSEHPWHGPSSAIGARGFAPMAERGFWRHTGSNEIWAVEIDNGRPVRCAGPLQGTDVSLDLLPYLSYTTSYLDALCTEWRSYVSQKLCAGCGSALLPSESTTPDGRTHTSCAA